jgi:hypothetical protein
MTYVHTEMTEIGSVVATVNSEVWACLHNFSSTRVPPVANGLVNDTLGN